MKRLAGVLALCLSLSAIAAKEAKAAEEAPASRFGVQAGVNVSDAALSPSAASTSKVGINVGAQLEMPLLLGLLFIQPELNFIQKGAQNSFLGSAATNTLDYFEIPVLLKAKINIAGVKPFVEAGPKLGVLIGASSSSAAYSRSNFNAFDLGCDFGGGAAYAISDSTELSLTVRYSVGVTNVVANAAAGSGWTNTGIQILVGVLF